MGKRQPDWDAWSGGFRLMCFAAAVMVPTRYGKGPVAEKVLAGVVAAGALGLFTVFLLRRRAKPPMEDEAQPERPVRPGCIGITYRTSRDANLRCEVYVLARHRASILRLIVFSLVVAVGAFAWVPGIKGASPSVALPLLFLLGMAVWSGAAASEIMDGLKRRFPTERALRSCTTSLCPDGVEDAAPDITTFIEWKRVWRVFESQGDVHIWTAWGGGCYVPAEAFETLEAARRFAALAESLRRSRGANWSEVAAQQGAW